MRIIQYFYVVTRHCGEGGTIFHRYVAIQSDDVTSDRPTGLRLPPVVQHGHL